MANPTIEELKILGGAFYQKDGFANPEVQRLVYKFVIANSIAETAYGVFNARTSGAVNGFFEYTRQINKQNLQKNRNTMREDGGQQNTKLVIPRPFKISGKPNIDLVWGDVWNTRDHPIVPTMTGLQAIELFRGDQTASFEHLLDEMIAWMHVKTAVEMDRVIAEEYVSAGDGTGNTYPIGRYSLGGKRVVEFTDTELLVDTKEKAIALFSKIQIAIREVKEQDHQFSRSTKNANYKIVMDEKLAESDTIMSVFHLSVNNNAPSKKDGPTVIGKIKGIEVVLAQRPIKDAAGKRLLMTMAYVGATKLGIADFKGRSKIREETTNVYWSVTDFMAGQWVLQPEMVLIFVEEGFDPEKPVYKEIGIFTQEQIDNGVVPIDGKKDLYDVIAVNADITKVLYLPKQYTKEGQQPSLPTSTLVATPTDETGAGLDDGQVASVGTLTLNSGTNPILKIINSVPTVVETIALADGAFNETFLNLPPDTYTVEVEASVSGSPFTLTVDTAIVNAGVFSSSQNAEAKKAKKEAKKLEEAKAIVEQFDELKGYELLDEKKASTIIANMSKSKAKTNVIIKVLLDQKAIKKT